LLSKPVTPNKVQVENGKRKVFAFKEHGAKLQQISFHRKGF